jgi:hypothetical protein
MSTLWTKAEERKLLAAVRASTGPEDAIARVKRALPGKALSFSAIDHKFRRLTGGKETPGHAFAAANAKAGHAEATDEVARFVTIAAKGGTLEELCDRFDSSPKKIKELIGIAKKQGFRIDVVGDHVGFVPRAPVPGERRVVASPGEENVFAVASDIHVGSKYFLEECFVDFVTRAYKEDGVRTVFGPGDVLDGCYRHSKWEEKHHGFQDQAAHAAKIFPKLPGLKYVMIAGNHDETFEKESGMDVCKALEGVFRSAGRDDLQMLGARGAYVRYGARGANQRGVLVELWHPLGGAAYAVSYQLQRHVENYGVGQKPDFCFGGHTHQQVYCVRRGVHCFWSGTFHGGGGSFSKALGGAQSIGGWIVRYKQTRDGTVRDVAPTWRSYYEVEDVRELGLG